LSPVGAAAPTRRARDGPSIFIRQGELFPSHSVSFERAHKVARRRQTRGRPMNGLIYLIGLIVVIMAILSFFGLR
jgi:predicted nucleic acid-binding Zn ribbon protein